jgi:hypothetical protein
VSKIRTRSDAGMFAPWAEGPERSASGRSQRHETLSGRLGGRGFRAFQSFRPSALGLAAHDPLSRPAKGEPEETEELQGPSTHGPESVSEPRARVKRRPARAARQALQ